MNATNKMRQGFTLIELLVVVAIIAVIGAGVAVTYRNLDDKAKTAMEMSDCSILQKVIKHWSVINGNKLPNRLDSLIGTDGTLYSKMTATSASMSGVSDSNGEVGLYGPVGYTFVSSNGAAVEDVKAFLAAHGLTQVYKHDLTQSIANDSTFSGGTMGKDVDTSATLFRLSDADENEEAIVNGESSQPDVDADGKYIDADSNASPYVVGGKSFATKGEYMVALRRAKEAIGAGEIDTLVFLDPDQGAHMSMGPMGSMRMAMNLGADIISNMGLVDEDVARPTETKAQAQNLGRKYWIVLMGLGRFASIYSGKGVRSDTPAVGKRQTQTKTEYSRYLAVIKVPVNGYDSMTNQGGEMSSVALVLTPNGYSPASLRTKYIEDEERVKDND